jgi:hypothetical protein
MKRLHPLTESQCYTLAEIMKYAAIPRARVRAHGILLSSQGMKIKEIAKIYLSIRSINSPYSEFQAAGKDWSPTPAVAG